MALEPPSKMNCRQPKAKQDSRPGASPQRTAARISGTMDSTTALSLADGYIAGVLPSQTLTLRMGMVFVPLVVMITAFTIIRRKYKIDEGEYNRLVAEIEDRKAQKRK